MQEPNDEIPAEEEILEEVPATEESAENAEVTEDSAPVEEEATEPEVLSPEMEAAKWKEAAIRSAADLDNYRKRMARERADDLRYARGGLIEELLPVFDNFAMGLQMAEQDQDSMIYKGMAMVKGQLDDFLGSQGVKEVEATGVFDPNLHEAIAEEESTDFEPGTILFVQRKGYQLHDRLLRAAAVTVAKAPEADKESETEAAE